MTYLSTPPDTRFMAWKKFRSEIKGKLPKEQLLKVAEFWANVPMVSRSTFDYHINHTEWDNPWEMVYDDLYCKNKIAVLMAHTLLLTGDWNINAVRLWEISDKVLGNQRLVVRTPHGVINFEHGVLSNEKDMIDFEWISEIPLNTI